MTPLGLKPKHTKICISQLGQVYVTHTTRGLVMDERPQTNASHVSYKTDSSSSTKSSILPSHREWTAFVGPVVYTGPNGERDQKVTVSRDFQMVGIGDRSPEITSQMSYLSRPPPGCKFPKAKNGQIGEIGWPVETFKIVKGI